MNLYLGKGRYVEKEIRGWWHELQLGTRLLMNDAWQGLFAPISRGAMFVGKQCWERLGYIDSYHIFTLFMLTILPYFIYQYAKIPSNALSPSSPFHIMASTFNSSPEIMIGLFVVGIFVIAINHNPLTYAISCLPILMYSFAILNQVLDGKYPASSLLVVFTTIVIVMLAGISIRARFVQSEAMLLLCKIREENKRLSSEIENLKKRLKQENQEAIL